MGGKHFHLPGSIFLLLVVCAVSRKGDKPCAHLEQTQYLLTFLAPGEPLVTSPKEVQACLVLINPGQLTSADIEVEGGNASLTLQPEQMDSGVCFDGSVVPAGSAKQQGHTGLLVSTTHSKGEPMVVQGTVRTLNGAVSSSAAFTVSPVTSLGTQYVVVTHCEAFSCFVGIVALQRTAVQVQLRLDPKNASLLYNGLEFFHGDVVEEELDRLQVMQILCKRCDMSGSNVTSSDPVAVLSGGEYTTVGEAAGPFFITDSVLEYLPPVDSLGTNFVIVKDFVDDYIVKVVAPNNKTMFTLAGVDKCFEATNEGDTWTLPLPRTGESTALNSTHPVLVSLLIFRKENQPSVRMTLLPPMSQWVTSYYVAQPFPTVVSNIFLAADFSNLKAGCIWCSDYLVNVTDDAEMGATVEGFPDLRVVRVPVNVTVAYVHLTCSPECKGCRPFGGYVGGRKEDMLTGWAMPLGTFPEIESPPYDDLKSTDTSTVLQETTPGPTESSTLAVQITSDSPSFQTTTTQENKITDAQKYACPCKCRSTSKTVTIEDLGLVGETSRQRNRKLSAPDKRFSATVIGCAGVSVLVSVGLVIVGLDVATLLGVKNAKFDYPSRRRSHRFSP